MNPNLHRNKNPKDYAFTILLCGGLLFSLVGCRVHYVTQVPVAPIQVIPVAPYAGAVWVDRGWAWRGGRHVWSQGYYTQPRRGLAYYPGEWKNGPRGNHYVRGRWR